MNHQNCPLIFTASTDESRITHLLPLAHPLCVPPDYPSMREKYLRLLEMPLILIPRPVTPFPFRNLSVACDRPGGTARTFSLDTLHLNLHCFNDSPACTIFIMPASEFDKIAVLFALVFEVSLGQREKQTNSMHAVV